MKKSVVVVGYGGMGGWHTEHILNSDVVSLAGVYDINEARREKAEEAGIRFYPSFEAVLEDKNVDIVVCATTNEAHEEISVRAMEAGKNVICEKPVTLSLESFDRIIETAKRTGMKFSVHQNRRWDADYLAMKSVKESGEIGEMINMESRIHGSRGLPAGWRAMKECGGGMIYDWGVHIIDQALNIMGFDVASVYCELDNITNDEVDDGFKMTVTARDGKKAFLEVGTYNFISMPRLYMRCTEGSAIIEDWSRNGEIIKCKEWKEERIVPVVTAAGLTKTMAPRAPKTVEKYELMLPDSDVHNFYRNFVGVIDGTAEQAVKWEESRIVLQVIMAAFESAKLGKIVVL